MSCIICTIVRLCSAQYWCLLYVGPVPTPLFEPIVRCTAHGPFFARLRYIYVHVCVWCVCANNNVQANEEYLLTGRGTISITNCLLLKLTAAIRTLYRVTEYVYKHACTCTTTRRWVPTGKFYAWFCGFIITPHACARGKVIGLSVCCCRCRCRHKNRQISRFRHLSDS